MTQFKIITAECLDFLRSMPTNCVDSIVTDPPYGLSFMGKKWDYDVPSEEIWAECLRVLKPGGHLLSFAGTRTQHRMACRIEDAGFEIRDMIAWVYGTGFPKSLDVSKAIDKAAGAEREVLGYTANARPNRVGKETKLSGAQTIGGEITAPATPAAQQWAGWGTALKPALEPITVARKPLIGTVAENVLQHGTGAINVDGCRVQGQSARAGEVYGADQRDQQVFEPHGGGRWPANLIHDGSEEVLSLFPVSASPWIGNPNKGAKGGKMFGGSDQSVIEKPEYRDSGSAARFFYCAKASKADRGDGNAHPTVKPTDLMRYLCRLVTPPNGLVLDPFAGSGSTGKGALLEGFRFIGIEREPAYSSIAQSRCDAVLSTINAK